MEGEATWKNIFDENTYSDIENLEDGISAARDGIVFAIDCKYSMFENDYVSKSFKAICEWMLRDIVANEKNMVGLVLFNTEKLKNSSDFKHIFVYQEFDMLGAERIKNLEKLIKEISHGKTSFNFGNIGSGKLSETSLAEVLWLCSNLFLHCKYKMGMKKIYLFTNDENPHKGNMFLQKQAIQRARDVNELDIDIALVGFPTANDKKFNINIFYKQLLLLSDEEAETYPKWTEVLDELQSRVRVKDYRKKAISKIPFVIGPEITIAISLYALVSATKMPTPVKLDKDTLEEIIAPKYEPPGDETEILPEDQDERYMEFGGAKIFFEPHEIRQLKDFGPPKLTLLGFKPLSCIKPYWFVRPAQFIYPDEKKIIGSTKLFRALLIRCKERQVTPICSFVSRRFSVPYVVALIPQFEELNKDGIQMEPPGFHVKYLPYAEDFRKVPYPPTEQNIGDKYKHALDSTREIVQRLKFTYDVTNFENPVLQRHYRVLEALALDRPSLKSENNDAYQDSTLPNYEIINERISKPVKELIKKLSIDNVPHPTKKAKLSLSGKIDVDYIEDCYEKGEFSKMTIPVLKEFCTILNIQKSSGSKDSFIKTLNKYFDTKS